MKEIVDYDLNNNNNLDIRFPIFNINNKLKQQQNIDYSDMKNVENHEYQIKNIFLF